MFRPLLLDDNFITPLRLFVPREKLIEFLQLPGIVPDFSEAYFRLQENLVISEFEALATCLASHEEILRPEDAFRLARSYLNRPDEHTLIAAIHVVTPVHHGTPVRGRADSLSGGSGVATMYGVRGENWQCVTSLRKKKLRTGCGLPVV